LDRVEVALVEAVVSRPCVNRLPQRRGKPRRPPIPNRGHQHRGGDKFGVEPEDPLPKSDRGSAQRGDMGLHAQEIVDPRRRKIVDLERTHGENEAGAVGKILMRESALAQPLRACALEEAQIGGVIDAARKVGVFVVDANRQRGARCHLAPAKKTAFSMSLGASCEWREAGFMVRNAACVNMTASRVRHGSDGLVAIGPGGA
jgi:hypothetical protein